MVKTFNSTNIQALHRKVRVKLFDHSRLEALEKNICEFLDYHEEKLEQINIQYTVCKWEMGIVYTAMIIYC